MKKWVVLGMTLMFFLTVGPGVFGETNSPEGKQSGQTLIAKAKKKLSKKKKKKKKKKKRQTVNTPIAFNRQVGNINA